MEPKLLRFIELIFESVEENYAEVKKNFEERGIFPDKLTEEVLSKIDKIKIQNKIADNKKILKAFQNTDIGNSSTVDYKIAANFRKKENISDEDIASIEMDKARLQLLQQMRKKDECTGKGSSKENS